MATDPGDRKGSNRRMRKMVADVREIGDIPAIVDPKRRKKTSKSLKAHCLAYHAPKFPLDFSPVHEELIEQIEAAVFDGSQNVMIVARGTGKTTICTCAIEWAICHGHRTFPFLVAADETKATRLLEGIKTEFDTNPLLLEDFPEICFPIQALERIVQRANGQTCGGESTFIRWKSNELVFPTTAEGRARGNAGAVLRVGGITGALRGAQATLPWGAIRRPDLVLCDDPQTRESANSPKQCDDREQTIKADVIGMAGPGKQIALVVTGTPIRHGDVICRLADNERNPSFRPVKRKMMESWPENLDLWHRYGEILRLCWIEKRPVDEATQFYVANGEAMRAGCRVYWDQRIDPGMEDAVQTAMTLWIRDPVSFAAEYQLEPEDLVEGQDVVYLTPEKIRAAVNNLPRSEPPVDATELVAFIDVQQEVLVHAVTAWAPGYVGSVLDYGTWPQQHRNYWTLLSLTATLSDSYQGSLDAKILAGLRELTESIQERVWLRSNGSRLHLSRGFIDAGWGHSTDVVFRFCREYGGGIWYPTFGVGITAGKKPLNEAFEPKPGQEAGPYFQRRHDTERHSDYYRYDANYYKTLVHKCLGTPDGDDGAARLWKGEHILLADHLRAEYPVKTFGQGREVVEWKLRPGQDNHLFDCLAGCCMGAAAVKIPLPGTEGYYQDSKKKTVRRTWTAEEFEARYGK